MPLNLAEYIKTAEAQLAPGLETRIARLAKEEREGQLYGMEKLQQAGQLTSGFRADMLERVMDIFLGRKEEARGEMGAKALSVAQQLYGLAQQAEQQEKQIASTERMAALDRELTQKGWSFQERQAELDRQLTKEGWDWQSKENILNRALSREELAQTGALTREGYALQKYLAQLGLEGRGVSGAGVGAPTYAPPAPTTDTSRSTYEKERPDFERRIQKAAEGFYKYEAQRATQQPAYPIKGISPTPVPYRTDKRKSVYY